MVVNVVSKEKLFNKVRKIINSNGDLYFSPVIFEALYFDENITLGYAVKRSLLKRDLPNCTLCIMHKINKYIEVLKTFFN